MVLLAMAPDTDFLRACCQAQQVQTLYRTFTSPLEQPGIALSLQQRRDAFESARPLAGSPPAPVQATWSDTHWAPGDESA